MNELNITPLLDLVFVLLVILLTMLWVIGTPGRLFACMLGLIIFALLVLIVVKPYRAVRLTGPGCGQSPTRRSARSIPRSRIGICS